MLGFIPLLFFPALLVAANVVLVATTATSCISSPYIVVFAGSRGPPSLVYITINTLG